ncbi:MAG: winged helix-turn-helix domain-containing protein [Actinomycetota bacterium]|nr:winged helix-turn-helix domain-containing protein [Actinomycetota bacterium]
MDSLDIRLLGPMEATVDGQPLPLRHAAERVLLALLVLSPGRPLSAAMLVDRLWGEDDLPVDPVNALQTRVSKLRRGLSAAGVDIIVRDGVGYRADVARGSVDVQRFVDGIAEARRSAGVGSPAAALESYDDALGLWRGEPLADFTMHPWASVEAARLNQLRLAALTERSELALRLGRHLEVVADLDPIVTEDPTQERLVGVLMTALYGAGRQADALQRYQRSRTVLVDELGLEPSAALRSLHQRILQHDDELAGAGWDQQPTKSDGRQLAAAANHVANGSTFRRSGTAVPAALEAPIGRAADLATVGDLLAQSRLVSLIGPGGAGKTTVAFAAARAVQELFPDGAWVAHLAAVREPGEVALAVADALGVPLDGSAPDSEPRERTVAYLRRRCVLLVLDNCEHVLDAAARLAHEVLAGCPDVRVLVTSREALAIPGEVQVAIAPLPVPPPRTPPDEVLNYPAAELFAQRCAAAGVTVGRSADEYEAVAQICRQLDGIPLAIELAAARLSTVSAVELAARLSDRFELLTGGARTADARQRTLRSAVEWSYNLLGADEQVMFRRLAIFQGGWTLAAAEAVTGDAQSSRSRTLDLLASLVTRSLVISETAGHTRYRMLDTLRHYAVERLEESGERETLAQRHADYFADLAEHAERSHRGGLRQEDMKALRDDQPNLRAAMVWLTDDPSRIDQALNLAGALGWFWHLGRHLEGRQALAQLLTSDGGSPSARARALQAVSLVERPRGCLVHPSPRCAQTAQQSLELFEQAGDESRAALSRILLAVEGVNGSHPARTQQLLERAERVFAEEKDSWGHAVIAFVRMECNLKSGDRRRALQIGRAGIDAFRTLNDAWGLSAMLYHLGWGLRQFGRYADAIPVLEEAIEVAQSAGLYNTAQWAVADKGIALLSLGELDAAGEAFERAQSASEEVGDAAGEVLARYGFGLTARITGDCQRAREQFSDAAAGFGRLGTPVWSGLAVAGLAWCDERENDVRAAEDRYEQVLATGETVLEPALVATALEGLARVCAATGRTGEVAALLERARNVRVSRNRPAPPYEQADLEVLLATTTA